MRIKNGKDFWAGLMFISFGLGFMVVARNYSMGTAVRMGPAYFPTILGGFMAVLGLMVLVRSFASRIVESLRVFTFRPKLFAIAVVLCAIAYWLKLSYSASSIGNFLHQLVLAIGLMTGAAAFGPPALYIVLSAVIIFAYLLKPLGLFLSTMLLVYISRAGGEDFSWREIPKSIVVGFAILIIFIVLFKVFGLFLPHGWAMSAATVVSIAFSVLVGRRMTGVEIGVLFGILGVFAVAVFVNGLGLPFNLCPELLDDTCRGLGLGG